MIENNLLMVIIFLPLLGSLFILGSKDESNLFSKNSANVALLTVLSNVFLILKLFSQIDTGIGHLQALNHFTWSIVPKIEVVFGVDVLALMIILVVHLVLAVGIFGLRHQRESQKSILFFAMLFLTAMNGYFAAVDLFSFYTFFALTIFPLFMQIGLSGADNKLKTVFRFFIYNFLGAFLLLAAAVIVYVNEGRSIMLGEISEVKLPADYGIWVWSGIFLAFVSRIPVWPFHYWITSVMTIIKNPLVFVSANLMPVVGLYGFIRFWPENVPIEISSLAPLFEILCMVTMVFIAIAGYSSKNLRDKLFSYVVVYYLLYLLGVFLPTNVLQKNIAYSLFAFLLVVAVMVMIVSHIEKESQKVHNVPSGILCLQPRASLSYSMLILAGIGLPVSALFWNNFLIISEIFNSSLYIGTAVVITLLLVAVSLLENLYALKDKSCFLPSGEKIYDIDSVQFAVSSIVMVILFLSLIKPLWFVY